MKTIKGLMLCIIAFSNSSCWSEQDSSIEPKGEANICTLSDERLKDGIFSSLNESLVFLSERLEELNREKQLELLTTYTRSSLEQLTTCLERRNNHSEDQSSDRLTKAYITLNVLNDKALSMKAQNKTIELEDLERMRLMLD